MKVFILRGSLLAKVLLVAIAAGPVPWAGAGGMALGVMLATDGDFNVGVADPARRRAGREQLLTGEQPGARPGAPASFSRGNRFSSPRTGF